MTSYFPDLNIWLALSVEGHRHNAVAWDWLNGLNRDYQLYFSRYTHLGLLRLLTNRAAMNERTLTVREAWDVYDQWLNDPRVEFPPEPRDLETSFRKAMAEFSDKSAPNWIGDCYLLAYAKNSGSALVTFDKALHRLAKAQGCVAVIPG